MLVQLAMVAFALCAMLSLIIDVGYARITQGQMQNAVDTAAIEGVRQQGAGEDTRRAAAGTFVSDIFDDDFDPTDGDPDYNFGAGPIIDLTDGSTTLHGAQLVTIPDTHVYKPVLQPNVDNATEGDMVSGRFCYNADPAPSEGSIYEDSDTVCGEPQLGTGNYARDDFNPGATPATPANAFLVRMRRSNDYQGLDAQTDPAIGSSGPSLPLTFGKATTIFSDDPSGGYSVRRDGLTVRATAIATTRPVLHLGTPQPGQRAIVPFTVVDTCVQSPTSAPLTIAVLVNPTTGIMTRAPGGVAAPGCAVGAPVGRFYATPTTRPTTLRTVGVVAPAANLATLCATFPAAPIAGYVAVSSTMATGPARVVGFATAALTRAAACPAGRGGGPNTPYAATIVRGAPAVAPANATALLIGGFPAGLTPALVTELLDKNLVRNGRVNYAPVLAPMLAR